MICYSLTAAFFSESLLPISVCHCGGLSLPIFGIYAGISPLLAITIFDCIPSPHHKSPFTSSSPHLHLPLLLSFCSLCESTYAICHPSSQPSTRKNNSSQWRRRRKEGSFSVSTPSLFDCPAVSTSVIESSKTYSDLMRQQLPTSQRCVCVCVGLGWFKLCLCKLCISGYWISVELIVSCHNIVVCRTVCVCVFKHQHLQDLHHQQPLSGNKLTASLS